MEMKMIDSAAQRRTGLTWPMFKNGRLAEISLYYSSRFRKAVFESQALAGGKCACTKCVSFCYNQQPSGNKSAFGWGNDEFSGIVKDCVPRRAGCSPNETIAETAFGNLCAHVREFTFFQSFWLVAAVGIPIRFYLFSAAAFNYQGLAQKFAKLFTILLVLDEFWALAPFLAAAKIGFGLAIAVSAALIYLPFSQRSLLLMAAPERSK
jgi:hypothetical protein